jgi:hypothetical protein
MLVICVVPNVDYNFCVDVYVVLYNVCNLCAGFVPYIRSMAPRAAASFFPGEKHDTPFSSVAGSIPQNVRACL